MAEEHKCTTITVKGEHVVCVDCGQHEMLTEISSEALAKLLSWIEEVHALLIKTGMEGAAETLRQRAGELVLNKRLVWKLEATA